MPPGPWTRQEDEEERTALPPPHESRVTRLGCVPAARPRKGRGFSPGTPNKSRLHPDGTQGNHLGHGTAPGCLRVWFPNRPPDRFSEDTSVADAL